MNAPSRKFEWITRAGLILIFAAIAGAFAWSRLGGRNLPLPVIGKLSDFSLTDQDGETVTLAGLRGKVWVADVIFTRCPGPCAKMTKHLAEVQAALPADSPLRIVTLTSDPDYDTPPVLKRYAAHFGADSNRWTFLTGDKQKLRHLAVNDFKFVVVEKAPDDREIPDDLFIHSTWFVLVDQQGQVRGWVDGQGQLHAYFDSDDRSARERLLSAMSQLLHEG
jgi:protein SCO1/2